MDAALESGLLNLKRKDEDEDEEDDDMPALSAFALQALNEFLHQRDEQTTAEAMESEAVVVGEDWQLSQFWYTEETSRTMAEEALEQAGPGGRIAFVSTPSAFIALKKLLAERKALGTSEEPPVEITLFEYDRRFQQAHPDEFVFYDYKHPTEFGDGSQSNNSERYKAYFDMVLIDPPFLSEECMGGFIQSARFISKPDARFLGATGRIMTDFLMAQGKVGCGTIRECQWRPKHVKLSNDFMCYVNYASTRLNPDAGLSTSLEHESPSA